MDKNSLISPNLFPVLSEIVNFRSKEYSKYQKYDFKNLKNRFFNQTGNFTYICHIFRNILQINWTQVKFKKIVLVGLNSRKSIQSKVGKSKNILEIWLSSTKNIFKRVCLILLKGEGDIWQFNFVKKLRENRILIRIILLFGTSIWIFDISPSLPQFLKIKNPFFKINLANVFQWKMCLGKSVIITGDISRKITFLNIKENIIINQFTHNKEKKVPIGDIKIIEINENTPKLLITGGYDGVLKIWSFCKKIFILKEIQFRKRWLIKISVTMFKEDYVLMLISFENGFESIVSVNNKIRIIKNYSNQGSSLLVYFLTKYIISAGNDGYINFIEINSPKTNKMDYLNLMSNPSFFVNWGIKSRLNNTTIQSIGVKYQNNQINFQKYISDRIFFSISGINGIVIVIGIKNKNH